MEHTNNYQLNLWDGEDRILREDFNADNAKIEAALLGASEAAAAAAASGLKIKTGTFSGNGATGTRTYNIGAKPKLVIARTTNTVSSTSYDTGVMITDFASILFRSANTATMADTGNPAALTDTGFSIKITNATTGLNASGSTLYYWALC